MYINSILYVLFNGYAAFIAVEIGTTQHYIMIEIQLNAVDWMVRRFIYIKTRTVDMFGHSWVASSNDIDNTNWISQLQDILTAKSNCTGKPV